MLWMLYPIFIVMLVPSLLARMTGWRWQPWAPGGNGRSSIVGEAMSAASIATGLAFEGY